MAKSLTELSEEYFKAAQDLDVQIRNCNKQLRKAYNCGDFLKTYELKRKLKIFYDQKNETLDTANLLKHYYDDNERSVAV